MKLFDKAVAWRVNKQNIVTTSLTKAELLVILQIVKEVIYLSQLMQALTLVLPEALMIDCNNAQTRRLLIDKSTKFQTKLKYVNIYLHWLKQKV